MSNRGIAILTNAGGPGVIAADALEKNGVRLAKLHEPTVRTLIAELPPAASVFNPVDMLASASSETYAACLRILMEDDNVEGVLVILPPPPMYAANEVAEKLIEIMESDSLLSESGEPLDTTFKKPVVVSLLGSTLVEEALRTFQRANIPTYPFPERAASALGALVRRAQCLEDGRWTIDNMVHYPSSIAGLSTEEILGRYSIPVASINLARSPEEAATIAYEIGYPVVIKIASPEILHKSDVGGVVLNIQDAAALHIAYTQILERVREARPDAQIEGVNIQQQLPLGQEVIVGAVRDPQFGPLMMFGSGGVEVEGHRDVAFALAPLTQAEALKMIRRTWAGKKLAGFRNLPPADEKSVVEVLVNLSQLMIDYETIQEVEINPVRVFSQGAIAVDVRMK